MPVETKEHAYTIVSGCFQKIDQIYSYYMYYKNP